MTHREASLHWKGFPYGLLSLPGSSGWGSQRSLQPWRGSGQWREVERGNSDCVGPAVVPPCPWTFGRPTGDQNQAPGGQGLMAGVVAFSALLNTDGYGRPCVGAMRSLGEMIQTWSTCSITESPASTRGHTRQWDWERAPPQGRGVPAPDSKRLSAVRPQRASRFALSSSPCQGPPGKDGQHGAPGLPGPKVGAYGGDGSLGPKQQRKEMLGCWRTLKSTDCLGLGNVGIHQVRHGPSFSSV